MNETRWFSTKRFDNTRGVNESLSSDVLFPFRMVHMSISPMHGYRPTVSLFHFESRSVNSLIFGLSNLRWKQLCFNHLWAIHFGLETVLLQHAPSLGGFLVTPFVYYGV